MVNHKILKFLLTSLGLLSVAIGGIGIVLPVLPTTPFILLSALLFSFSNEKLGSWLERNKILGPYLRHYRQGNGVSKPVKAKALISLWVGMGITFYLVGKPVLITLLAVIASLVSLHILLIKPKRGVHP